MKRLILEQLIKWKGSKYRKPLILKGARQIGKTYILKPVSYTHLKVTVNADGASQMAMINSDEVTSAQFYKVGTPTIDSAETSEHEITLNVTGVEINGKTTTYKVKVFDVNSDPEVADLVLKATKDVEVKDGKIVIDGLESNKPYSFKLIAIVDLSLIHICHE